MTSSDGIFQVETRLRRCFSMTLGGVPLWGILRLRQPRGTVCTSLALMGDKLPLVLVQMGHVATCIDSPWHDE